ncbi:Gfo/Idh/MocA family oxidoreductase [Buttiauxella sp. A2-C1_F]|uniref:Gfo/Idh/MocA family protein n=1 Tax=Buttiauxella sp. A2-C1_F TaxID=2904526 RepID=UPI001E4A095A|nr:Gfo/Idh/MocA family oxidoreductase [Buttiauxella sp. A2-C1_F]MCE0844038.1 Gfo/Idh/MocA family oxidoreductase [Buttiauxella sp. A2-C1_F]
MDTLLRQLEHATRPVLPKRPDYKIGIIGAGFIVEHCHLVAYQKAGFTTYAITSREQTHCHRLAELFGIEKVYTTWQEMVCDPQIEIVDIAVPPHVQLEIVRFICGPDSPAKHIKGILCQKPLAMSLEDGQEIVRLSEKSGIPVAVNSNMRYDPSIRALKYIIENQLIGTPVIASIDMRAIPDWQIFLQQYKRLELYAMAIHHIDAFRFLFGDPVKVTAVCRTDPRTSFEHTDGITQYTFQYANGLIATSLDDVWAWPGEPCAKNNYINWRVEGTAGLTEGDFGWHRREPEYCGSTLKLASHYYPGQWISPQWERQWFPDAFIGTMANLMCAIEDHVPPQISAKDNLKTLACIEASYVSIQEERTVYLNEILPENTQ